MKPKHKAYLELHIAVFLFGFTAILGDLIQLSAVVIVWWRVFLTSMSLLFLIRFGKTLRQIPHKRILQYMGIGCIVGLHWITFYGAIKFANASIALIAMATTAFFTSLIEPIVLRQPVKYYEIGLGILIVPGMFMIVNHTEIAMLPGLWVGLLSAFLASLFASLNKKLISQADPFSITFLELGSAWLFICLIFPFYFFLTPEAQFWPGKLDWGYLIVLALLCTTLAYVLALRSLNHLSAFASNLVINLEPIYGILLAWILLREDEELTGGFYIGGLCIIIVVLCYPILRRRFRQEAQEEPANPSMKSKTNGHAP